MVVKRKRPGRVRHDGGFHQAAAPSSTNPASDAISHLHAEGPVGALAKDLPSGLMAKTTVKATVPSPNLQKLWKRGYTKVRLFRRPKEKIDPREVIIDPPAKPQVTKVSRKEGQEYLFIFGEDSKHENLDIYNFTFIAGENLTRAHRPPPWELSETISELVAKFYRMKIEDVPNHRRPRHLQILPAEIRQAIIEKLFGEPSSDYSVRDSNNYVAPAFDIVAIRALAATSLILAVDIVQIGSVIARRLIQRLQHLRGLSLPGTPSMKKIGCSCVFCGRLKSRKVRETQQDTNKQSIEDGLSPKLCPVRIQHETMIVKGYAQLLLRIVSRILRRSVKNRRLLGAEQIQALQDLRTFRASKDL